MLAHCRVELWNLVQGWIAWSHASSFEKRTAMAEIRELQQMLPFFHRNSYRKNPWTQWIPLDFGNFSENPLVPADRKFWLGKPMGKTGKKTWVPLQISARFGCFHSHPSGRRVLEADDFRGRGEGRRCDAGDKPRPEFGTFPTVMARVIPVNLCLYWNNPIYRMYNPIEITSCN